MKVPPRDSEAQELADLLGGNNEQRWVVRNKRDQSVAKVGPPSGWQPEDCGGRSHAGTDLPRWLVPALWLALAGVTLWIIWK